MHVRKTYAVWTTGFGLALLFLTPKILFKFNTIITCSYPQFNNISASQGLANSLFEWTLNEGRGKKKNG